MAAELRIFQQMFRAAMNASCLHISKVTLSEGRCCAPETLRSEESISAVTAASAFRTGQRWESYVTITSSRSLRSVCVSEHISRKELKQDKIKETIEHDPEAVISHGQFTLILVTLSLSPPVASAAYPLSIP